jgi:hypothetical protein
MGKSTGDHEFGGSSAISNLTIQSIDPALSRAELTLFEDLHKKLDSLLEFSFLEEVNIRRDETHITIIAYPKLLWNPVRQQVHKVFDVVIFPFWKMRVGLAAPSFVKAKESPKRRGTKYYIILSNKCGKLPAVINSSKGGPYA